MASDRAHDVVLLGATGFTGGLTAEYLVANSPPDSRLALAGRNRAKLEALRSRLAQADPARAELPLLHADSSDEGSLRELAESARVVVSTVGPYIRYGEPLVAACAAAGTDYADLTGEPEFVDLMYVRHHARAAETGARLVHACGFDSIPHDLGRPVHRGAAAGGRGHRPAWVRERRGPPVGGHVPLRHHRLLARARHQPRGGSAQARRAAARRPEGAR